MFPSGTNFQWRWLGLLCSCTSWLAVLTSCVYSLSTSGRWSNSNSLAQLLSRSVTSDYLWPHGLQHSRFPCPSSPGACSNSCPLSRWCHLTISSSVIPFSSCLQSFPASEFFQWVSSSHQVAKILELQLQYQSFLWVFRVDFQFWATAEWDSRLQQSPGEAGQIQEFS